MQIPEKLDLLRPVRVLLVTSNRAECGIREYGRSLIEAMRDVGKEVEIHEFPYPDADDFGATNPAMPKVDFDVLHLNHHAALHASWTPEFLSWLKRGREEDDVPDSVRRPNWGIVVTQHDTFEKHSTMLARGYPDFRCADALVIHEEVEGLRGKVRMGSHLQALGATAGLPNVFLLHQPIPPLKALWGKRYSSKYQLYVGSVGFPFPWKNYPLLCKVAKEAGWGVYIHAPRITSDQVLELQAAHPDVEIEPRWLPRDEVVQRLHDWCDVTAFLYQTGNSGTSAAIRTGIAARRPVLAFQCRQFRDLMERDEVWWLQDAEDLHTVLKAMEKEEVRKKREGAIRRLADEQSWEKAADVYRMIYHWVQIRREQGAREGVEDGQR